MRTQSRNASPVLPLSNARTAPKAPSAAPARSAMGWKTDQASVTREVRSALTHPQGRSTFAELLENHLGDPNTGIGYAWDAADRTPLQWTLKNNQVGDDSLLVKVRGNVLTIQSEMSGFTGKASIAGGSREALDAAVRAAVKDLDAVAERNRGR